MSTLARAFPILSTVVIATVITLVGLFVEADGSVRIKDITTVNNDRAIALIGFGLVIGLNGSGDGKSASFTKQSLANMIERMGLTVNTRTLKVNNVAAVMVTAKLSSHDRVGYTRDVSVSSIGDASSLQGGTLLMTPLADITGTVYALAQGAVSIGGFNVSVADGDRIFNNYTLVGRVPNGARISRAIESSENDVMYADDIILSLKSPDYTTASRIVSKINNVYGRTAYPMDDANIRIALPDSLSAANERVKFISDMGQLRINPDATARVIMNEKTGTIVAGEHVSIGPVAIAHGTITVSIEASPVISQPAPFSLGETVVTSDSRISIDDDLARVIHIEETVSIADLAQALNAIGATPRDIIAIFQALKQAGALRGELVIL